MASVEDAHSAHRNQHPTAGTVSDTILKGVTILASAGAGITALAFWFGWAVTNARSEYFGIDASLLGYTTTDYVLRSADVMLVPAISVLLLLLLGLGLHAVLMTTLKTRNGPGAIRGTAQVLLAVGLAATVFGAMSLFIRLPIIQDHFLVAPGLIGGGPIAVAYGTWLVSRVTRQRSANLRLRDATRWERIMFATVSILAVVCLFWGTSRFASGLGIDRARSLAENLSTRPVATVYSKTDLSLPEPVQTTVLDSPGTLYRFRYSGLRFITRSNGQYFLLTEGWTRAAGLAIVLQDTSEIRYEFRPGGAGRP